MKYSELPRTFIRRIRETNIVAFIVKGGTLTGIRRTINKAIYEAWCRNLYLLNDMEIEVLKEHRSIVYDRFLELCSQSAFLQVIRSGDKKSFLAHFSYIGNMLGGNLK